MPFIFHSRGVVQNKIFLYMFGINDENSAIPRTCNLHIKTIGH